MKINSAKLTEAKRQKRLAELTQADPEKAKLVTLFVELSPFYGSRTVRKLLKYVRGVKVPGLPIRNTPKKNSVNGYKGHAIAELNKYSKDRQGDLLLALKDVPTQDLREALENLSSTRLETRYGSRQFSDRDLGAVELKEEREVQFKMHHARLKKWLRESKKSVKEREAKRKEQKKLERKEKREKARRKPRKLTTNAYLRNLQKWNESMATRYPHVAHQ